MFKFNIRNKKIFNNFYLYLKVIIIFLKIFINKTDLLIIKFTLKIIKNPIQCRYILSLIYIYFIKILTFMLYLK